MNISTDRPIVYSGADGEGMKKIKGLFKKKEGGTMAGNALRGLLGGKGGSGGISPQAQSLIDEKQAKEADSSTPSKKGLSTGAWVGIGLGALLLIGGGIYFATKKK